jgi:hypothetical protein
MPIQFRRLITGAVASIACVSAVYSAIGGPTDPEKLLPPGDGGWFGGRLSLENGTLVVGAQWLHGQGPGRGTAFIFEQEAGQWKLSATLQASDGQGWSLFGSDVATDGSTVVVGDPDYLVPRTTGSIRSAGAAYIYQQTAAGWTETQKLMAPVATVDERFGGTVNVSGNTVFIGSGKGMNIFENVGGVWAYQTTLQPSVPDGFGLDGSFGGGIAAEGDVVLIGARSQDKGGLINSGAVFAFERGPMGWSETAMLMPSDPVFHGKFGYSLDMSGDTAIIGRPAGGPAASGPFQGAAYIFEKVGSQWVESAKLQASDGFLDDGFGSTVTISGGLAAVTATGGDTPRIYLFSKAGDAWQEIGRLDGVTDFPTDQFGIALEMEGSQLVVGARLDDDRGRWAGAVYLYQIPEPGSTMLAGMLMIAVVLRRAS